MTPGFFSASVATGLAGFDPAPMLIAAAALTAGVPRRHLFGFSAALIGGTAAVGWLLSRILGHALAQVNWYRLLLGHRASGVIELLIGLALIGYAVVRIRAASRPEPKPDAREPQAPRGVAGLYVVAATFTVIVIGDPAFPLFVGVSSEQHPASAAIGWVIWAITSQFPLVILAVATAFGASDRVTRASQRLRKRLAPKLATVTTGLVLAAAALAIGIAVVTLIRTR